MRHRKPELEVPLRNQVSKFEGKRKHISLSKDTQTTWRPQFIWSFDSHGIFHLIQMLGLLMISIGLYRAIGLSKEMEKGDATR